ncbi:MAG: glycerol-3-phosphate 1-O-acyltransferase PlsY [Sphingomonadales bacterium]|jgi:glycerol-3-phosphate acyltransferase PlsY|nr:glycerol-3-phosphate 1-O-acyltransferase PlsY [Sphingomonadales bacterium]MBK6490592.1 glycerol-3-phosphate 1-O-acyltransferase PlsY [Sphingomonadales bacterium]MBK6719451.1 glycerol-3-phosphate 1-O-acyltransferase PlsY [Sphingomonadales bacterium]MBK7284122.1 glycerol-3-phosphate 1-O-acyltransferase PlsY [Sphingomonadales bacterium]MBK8273143.1 glycerol-3-phosphate 1-O-acyltransferase PlsY [Sphingomonadales bacterium]
MADIVWTVAALPVGLGYLLGSIPFGLILTRLMGAGDLRTIGSGNIGATNVLRTGRKGLAAATLLLDMAKGAAAVLIGQRFGQDYAVLAGMAAFLGHVYPVWLKFRGGKGVATMLGVTLALHWGLGLTFALVWLAALAATRISSVGGMAAAISAPIAASMIGRPGLGYALLVLALIVIWKHSDNIGRLIDGSEPKVGRSKK